MNTYPITYKNKDQESNTIKNTKNNNYHLGNTEENGPFGRPRCRWEDSFNIGLREIGWGDIDWIDLAQNSDQWLRSWQLLKKGSAPWSV
jgi:hypothetical protein